MGLLCPLYHQLDSGVEAQEQWQSANAYLGQALATYRTFTDEYSFGIVHASLRRLWQTHPDEAILPTLAQALGLSVDAARGWITTAA